MIYIKVKVCKCRFEESLQLLLEKGLYESHQLINKTNHPDHEQNIKLDVHRHIQSHLWKYWITKKGKLLPCRLTDESGSTDSLTSRVVWILQGLHFPVNHPRNFKPACFGEASRNGGERKVDKTPTEECTYHVWNVKYRLHRRRRKVVWTSGGGRGRGRRPCGVYLRDVQAACGGFNVLGWKWRRTKPNQTEAWVSPGLGCELLLFLCPSWGLGV